VYPELTFAPEVWDGVLHRLQQEVPSFTFETWLQPLEPRRVDEGLLLLCPSPFHKERIHRHFLARIDACLRAENGQAVEIALGLSEKGTVQKPKPGWKRASGNPASAKPPTEPSATRAEPTTPSAQADPVEAPEIAPEPSKPRPALRVVSPASASPSEPAPRRAVARPSTTPAQYSFDSFVVGPCNALAREAAFAMARDQQQTLNQLYLRADSGMGKTHLARAVSAEAASLGAGEVKYVSSENFTNQFLSALRSNRTGDFKRRYRGRQQLLVVEDVQFLENKAATQLEFFHTVQHVLDAGGRVMLTGDRMPQDMPELSPRLQSQLSSGFVAELDPPDHRVRRSILRAKAAHGAIALPSECLDILVENLRGSVRELEGALIQLVTTASLLKRPIDLEMTESALAKKNCVSPRKRPLGIGDVVGVVAGFFQCSPEQLASRSRRKQVLVPRQLAMYLCRRYTDAPVGKIGEALGRNHPAVRNAIDKIERDILERPPLRYQVEALGERLDSLTDELGAGL